MKAELDKEYWEGRYRKNDTGWDLGEVSPPLEKYFQQLDVAAKILIPGCGNAHEAAYLHKKDFGSVFLVDIAINPLKAFKKNCPDFPSDHLLHQDFFNLEGEFDVIVEQTFFCAIHPGMREVYAKKMASLLRKGGRLVGLLFNDSLNVDEPPFGGDKDEYITYFSPYFVIEKMEPCYNSIPPRAGRELFINLIKK